jgi:hypothetical protein
LGRPNSLEQQQGTTMMREYKLPATFFAKLRTRVLVWTLILSGVCAVVGIRIGMVWVGMLGLDDESSLPASVLFPTLVIALIAIIVGIRIGLVRVQRSWASYRLILGENSIRRLQDGYPEITIQNSEISKITETEVRGLVVYSTKPYTYIGIPRAMEEYVEVRSDLAKKHTIESISHTRGKLMPVLIIASSLFTLVAYSIIFLATNKYVIVATGILLFILLLVSVVVVQRSGSTSKLAKRNSWFVLLLLLAIAIRVVFILENW